MQEASIGALLRLLHESGPCLARLKKHGTESADLFCKHGHSRQPVVERIAFSDNQEQIAQTPDDVQTRADDEDANFVCRAFECKEFDDCGPVGCKTEMSAGHIFINTEGKYGN